MGLVKVCDIAFCHKYFSPLKAELNPICHLLALIGAHHILHVSRIRVNVQTKCDSWRIKGAIVMSVSESSAGDLMSEVKYCLSEVLHLYVDIYIYIYIYIYEAGN